MPGLSPAGSTLAESTIAWLLTYLVHSSLLLALAWMGWRLLPEGAMAAKEMLWRLALLGGLVTATFQIAAGIEPLAGTWNLAPRAPTVAAQGTPREESFRLEPRAAEPPLTHAAPREIPDAARRGLAAGAAAPELRVSWSGRLAALWLAVGGALLLRLGISHLRLRRRLASRRELTAGPTWKLLERLLAASGFRRRIRLSASPEISVPLARGLVHGEICLPARSLQQLSEEQQEIVLAHELAHLERRDPLWKIATHLLERVFFLQPLNRLARRALEEIAEYRCDDRAVERTGRPISMAKCLARVAEWSLEHRGLLPVPSLGADRSRLGRRVNRLLARDYPRPQLATPRWLPAAAWALVGLVAVAGPGVGWASRAAEASPRPAAAETTPEPRPETAPEPQPEPKAEPQPATEPRVALEGLPAPAAAPASPAPSAPPRPAAAPAPPAPPQSPFPGVEILPPEFERALLEVELAELAELGLEAIELSHLEEIELHAEDLGRLGEMAGRVAQLAVPDAEAMARLEELAADIAERAQPDPEALARLTELATRLTRTQVAEEAARLREEVRHLAEELRPNRDELRRLREEARRLAAEMRPSEEQLRELREEARRLREEARAMREEAEARRAEAEARRQERRREEGERREEREKRPDGYDGG